MVIDIMVMGHSALVMPEDGAADTPWTRDSNAQTADCDGKQSHSQITHTYIETENQRTRAERSRWKKILHAARIISRRHFA